VRKQHIPKLTASALSFIVICLAVIGALDIFTEARSPFLSMDAPSTAVGLDGEEIETVCELKGLALRRTRLTPKRPQALGRGICASRCRCGVVAGFPRTSALITNPSGENPPLLHSVLARGRIFSSKPPLPVFRSGLYCAHSLPRSFNKVA